MLAAAAAALAVAAVPPIRTTVGRAIVLLASGQLGAFQTDLQSLGAWAPVVSITLLILASIAVPLPVAIIMVANGLVFGVWRGMLVSLAGSLAGAITAYAIGRFAGRAALERFLPAPTVAAADRLSRKYGAWVVMIERWVPGVPCDPVSYAAGLTAMPIVRFVALTTIGLVPANAVTAYLGSEVAGDIPMRYWFSGIAMLVGAWFVWSRRNRLGRRRVARSLADQ